MTQDEIIEMASEAAKGGERMAVFTLFELKAFAELVAAKATAVEREACAKVCEQIDTAAFGGERPAPNDCAAAIRARGEA
jgi:hypothetical protein